MVLCYGCRSKLIQHANHLQPLKMIGATRSKLSPDRKSAITFLRRSHIYHIQPHYRQHYIKQNASETILEIINFRILKYNMNRTLTKKLQQCKGIEMLVDPVLSIQPLKQASRNQFCNKKLILFKVSIENTCSPLFKHTVLYSVQITFQDTRFSSCSVQKLIMT